MLMQHITIHTAKIEESVAFYRDVVGLKLQHELKGEHGPHIVFLAGGENETCVELLDDAKQPYNGTGLSIGFHAGDLEQKRAQLAELGLSPTPFISPNPHVKFFFVKDPNGVSIQFI